MGVGNVHFENFNLKHSRHLGILSHLLFNTIYSLHFKSKLHVLKMDPDLDMKRCRSIDKTVANPITSENHFFCCFPLFVWAP
jgi:hypothetical protein